MATPLPRPQAPQQPFHLTPDSPPKPFLHNVTQHQQARDPADPIAQQPVTDSRLNGTSAHGNTNLLVPKGPHALTTNGDPSRRATMPMNGMPFNAARSPPNAKSTVPVITLYGSGLTRGHRYFACPLQILPPRSMSGWKSLPVLPFHRPLIRRHSVQVLRQGTPALLVFFHHPVQPEPPRLISSRGTANSAPNALWRISFPTDDG